MRARRPVRVGDRAHRGVQPDRGGHHGHHPAAGRLPKIASSVAPLIGEAIRRIHDAESVGALFSSEIQLVQEMGLWSDRDEATSDASERTA